MGLAASQCRLLMLTSRKSDVEGQMMSICNEKLSLSRQSAELSDNYTKELNATKLVWNTNSGSSSTDLTYDTLMASGLSGGTQYMLTDSSGKVVLDNSYQSILGATSGNAGDIENKYDETSFLEAMGIDEATAKAAVSASGSSGSTSNPSASNVSFTTNYNDDDIRKYLNANDNSQGMFGFTSDTSYAVAITDNSGANMASQAIISIQNATGCMDAAVVAVLTATGSFSSEAQSEIKTAADNAKSNTDAYYEEQVKMGNGTSSPYPTNDVIDSIYVNSDSDAQTYISQNPTNNQIVTTGSTYFVNMNEVLKYFLNCFDAACASISECGEVVNDSAVSSLYTANNNGVGNDGNWMGGTFCYYTSTRNSTGGTGTSNSVAGSSSSSSTTSGSTDSTAANYYIHLYEAIDADGWSINDNVTNADYLENQLLCGGMAMNQWTGSGWSTVSLSGTDSPVSSVSDEDAITQAEAQYNADKDKLDYKEKLLDVQSNNLDTERSAITTEIDSVHKLITENIKIFKMFDA